MILAGSSGHGPTEDAVVECNNGVVIRKLVGYAHIPQLHAGAVNLFYANSLNPYLNFHWPCFFAVDTLSPKGKIVKTYPNDKIMTPWDWLRQIQDLHLHLHLKPGITELSLAELATRQSDSQAASQLQNARTLVFQSFNSRTKSAA